jgi:GntR family transcriptional regulator
MSKPGTFRFLLSPNSGAPLYRQLMDQLRVELFSGRLAPGTMLPSVRQVAQDLEINPMTVSKAYSKLQEEGVLERVPGMGMRVREDGYGDRQERVRRTVLPLLEEAVKRAVEAGLTRAELLSVMEPLLEDLDHE